MGKSESQMDIMEKSNKPGKHRWTATEIGLFVLLMLVSCALAGLVVLYTSAAKGKAPLSSSQGSDPILTSGGANGHGGMIPTPTHEHAVLCNGDALITLLPCDMS